MGRPFYAGLAAYGYAAHYTAGGALVELRGDLDPARVASDPNFEMIERRAFDPAPAADVSAANPGGPQVSLNGGPPDAGDARTTITGVAVASHWRYLFRARAAASLDGLGVRAGEHLLLDVPTAEALRVSVRVVRERGGAHLLGLCLFRLPGDEDATTLTLGQIAAALADQTAEAETKVSLSTESEGSTVDEGVNGGSTVRVNGSPPDTRPGDATVGASSERLVLSAESAAGAGGALPGEALSLTLAVPAGGVRGLLSLEGFTNVETLCGAGARGGIPVPCGARRANVLRFTAPAWQPGARARAVLSVAGPLPARLFVETRVRADDGRVRQTLYSLTTGRRAAHDSVANDAGTYGGGAAPAEEHRR